MREILFRGKRIDNGEWVCSGNLIHFNEGDQHFIANLNDKCITTHDENDHIIAIEDTRIYKVIPETVGQYTGLTDKNGKKIFEGDIFKFNDEVWESYYTSCGTEYNSWEVENYGVVGFDEDLEKYDFVKYKFNENSVEADLHENHDIEFSEFVRELEVIGNIHDNPELLKGGENG